MALTDPSEWTQKKSTYGTNTPPVPGTTSGMTNKQVDMSTARNPMNFNMPNQVQPEKPEQQKELKQTAQQRNDYQQQMGAQNVHDLKSKIGGAAYQVQGLVNKFLTKGNTNIDVAQVGEVVHGADGNYVVKNFDPSTLDVSQAAEEKQAELELIRQQAKPFYYKDPATGKWTRRDMSSSVKQLTDYDKLDATGKAQVDHLMGLTSLINEYEKSGEGNSAEALSIRQQLQQLDKNGTISGMYQAIKDYQKFVGEGEQEGMAWYGDQGAEGQTLEDILNLDMTSIENEIRKAATLSSGLFGGEYESSIKSGIDYESAEGKAALKEEAAFRNKLKEASKTYFGDVQTEMMKSADAIKAAFKSAAPAIIESMGNTPEAMAARDFFTQLSSASPQDFTQLISNLLYNPESGLATEQRKLLREYLGNVLPGGKATGDGKIADWISELSSQGYIDLDDGKGGTIKVEPTAEDKYQILNAMNKGDTDSVKKTIDGMMNRYTIGSELKSAVTAIQKTGDVQGATNKFAEALVKSLSTFASSKTEDAVRKSLGISDLDWKKMDQKTRSDAISRALQANPSLVMDTVKATSVQSDRDLEQVIKQTKDTILEGLGDLEIPGKEKKPNLKSIITNLQSSIEALKGRKGVVRDSVRAYLRNNIVMRSVEPTKVYKDYFSKYMNEYSRLGHDQAFLQNTVSSTLGMRDALLNFQKQNPVMYDNLYKGPEIEAFLRASGPTAMTMALDSKGKMYEAINKLFQNWDSNADGSIDTVINNTPTLTNAQNNINTLLSNAEQEYAKAINLQDKSKKQLEDLDKMYKDISGVVFSPDEISRQAMYIAKNFGVSDLKELTFGQGYKGANKEDVAGIVPESFENLLKPIRTNFDVATPEVDKDVALADYSVKQPDVESFYSDATAAQRDYTNKFVASFQPDIEALIYNVPLKDRPAAENALLDKITRSLEKSLMENPDSRFKAGSSDLYDIYKKVFENAFIAITKRNKSGRGDGRDRAPTNTPKQVSSSVPGSGQGSANVGVLR